MRDLIDFKNKNSQTYIRIITVIKIKERKEKGNVSLRNHLTLVYGNGCAIRYRRFFVGGGGCAQKQKLRFKANT